MNRDIFIRNLTKEKIEMSPKGRNADELTVEEFEKDYERKYERNSHYAFIFAKNDEYGYFWNNFGKHFQR